MEAEKRMDGHLRLVGEKIIERKYEIAKKVHNDRLAGISDQQKAELAPVEEAIIQIRADFISLFGETLHQGLDKKTAFKNILKWGKETGALFYKMGVPLDEALMDTQYYRLFLWNAIREEIKQYNMSMDTVFEIGSIIDPLLDQAVYSFSLTYVQSHQETMEKAKTAFVELSVPVVPVASGIAILPLIGNIDTERANIIMEETLKAASRLNLSQLVLDLSGVMIVDTMVADQLFKIIASLKLLGVDTILTGIRPEIAQTIVHIGIDFKKLSLKANLQQALKEIYTV
jgi:rsbT co-antagonist protein RsbR